MFHVALVPCNPNNTVNDINPERQAKLLKQDKTLMAMMADKDLDIVKDDLDPLGILGGNAGAGNNPEVGLGLHLNEIA